MNTNELLEGIVAPLEQALEQAKAHRDFLRSQLAEANADARKISKTLRTLKGDEEEKEKKPRGRKRASQKSKDDILAIISKHGPLRQQDIVRYYDGHESSVCKAVKDLRDEGVLRKAGQERRSNIIAIMNEEVPVGV